MFYFNADKYDYWCIYDCVKRFYPVGVPKDDSRIYFSYPGHKELVTLLVDNIHERPNYESRWESFIEGVQNKIGKPLISTTYGQAPSFSARLELESEMTGNLTRVKELHFFVSILGPFYTIVGQDKTEIRINLNVFRPTNYLIVSPENEYAETFLQLCELIEHRFPGYRFVSYSICHLTIEGLAVHYTDQKSDTVFNALFNDHIDFGAETLGNAHFKADENWIREGYVPPIVNWTAHPPDYKS